MLGRDVGVSGYQSDQVCPVSFWFYPGLRLHEHYAEKRHREGTVLIGKPEPIMVDCVLKNTELPAGRGRHCGRPSVYTDIATGKNAGVDAVCVLSGEATLSDIEEGDIKPDSCSVM